ncbi:MAG: ribbon-helix-helix protein, CopG family [Dehalococcoidia bacterium]|nr:MAG: ribbon-helix-helix protein, CopG family [Dehalococcoidia bacterium]
MTERIAISLDAPLLRAIERERKRLRLSRSEFIRFAAKAYFDAIERKRRDDEYERAYREVPETREEIAIAEASSADAFRDDAW